MLVTLCNCFKSTVIIMTVVYEYNIYIYVRVCICKSFIIFEVKCTVLLLEISLKCGTHKNTNKHKNDFPHFKSIRFLIMNTSKLLTMKEIYILI
jgi:hypothetical protein